ncbi:MAG: sugar transferase, partial [Aliifodinibius sp.]|nr:sugar transferase [Fodinibius sp.]NIY25827.1 sugar transferase [Fodinibius sp.]
MIKRIFDIIVSLILLNLFSPILLLGSLIVFLSDGLPIFFVQDRLGKGGNIFRVFKFRSMV